MWEKSVAQKLMIKPEYKVLFINAPEGYEAILGKMPDRVNVLQNIETGIDFVQLFVSSAAELEAHLKSLKPMLKPNGILWVSYPKGTSKIKADINRDSINAFAQSIGLQGVAMVSIDNTWSALRLKII